MNLFAKPSNPGDPRHLSSRFFRLTAARNGRIQVVRQPRIEGRGVAPGPVCAAPQSHNLGAELNRARIKLLGNKFGRLQVLGVDWNCARTLLGRTMPEPCRFGAAFTSLKCMNPLYGVGV